MSSTLRLRPHLLYLLCEESFPLWEFTGRPRMGASQAPFKGLLPHFVRLSCSSFIRKFMPPSLLSAYLKEEGVELTLFKGNKGQVQWVTTLYVVVWLLRKGQYEWKVAVVNRLMCWTLAGYGGFLLLGYFWGWKSTCSSSEQYLIPYLYSFDWECTGCLACRLVCDRLAELCPKADS